MASVGGTVLVLGLAALGLGWLLPASASSLGGLDPDRLNLKISLMLFGSVMSQLGALGFFSGKIIEALSFLPGKDMIGKM
jgi:hypothetical protein